MRRSIIIQLLILVLSGLLFIPGLGGVHLFDWDEINFAESAREMIATGNYLDVQINYQPFWEKPPLFTWLQVLSMKIFGINEFAARFPNAVAGMLTLWMIFLLGRKLYEQRFGIYWTLVYAGSILPFFYFKSGIIDPWFNLFIFISVSLFAFFNDGTGIRRRNLLLVWSAISIGLAILTKGPAGLLVFLFTLGIYWAINRFTLKITAGQVLLYILLVILVGGAWFILQIITGNVDVVVDFIVYQYRLFTTQDAGHGGFFMYHFVILFSGVFPASVYALKAFKRSYYDEPFQKRFKRWMIILFWVVLILFSIVETKIVHYSSMAYFPITYLGAYSLFKISKERMIRYRWLNVFLGFIGGLYALVMIVFPYVANNFERWIDKGIITDPFTIGTLQAQVYWPWTVSLTGVLYLLAVIGTLLYTRRNAATGYLGLFIATGLFTLLGIYTLTGRIEKYTQAAAVEFYKEHSGEDAYMRTLGFKSYANLYYFRKPPPEEETKPRDTRELLSGDIERPLYVVMKIDKKEDYLNEFPELQVLYEKNGFVFCVRRPAVKDRAE